MIKSISWPLPTSLFFVILFSFGCTTTAPTGEGQAQSDYTEQRDPDRELASQLSTDAKALSESYFTSLVRDPKPIERWEENEGWIHLFQGQYAKAITAFEDALKGNPPAHTLMSSKIGLVRAHLEQAEVYLELKRSEDFLFPQWIELERRRPTAKHYEPWYQWMESAFAERGSKETLQAKYTHLASAEMSPWAQHAVRPQLDLPAQPSRVSSSYQRWVRFMISVSEEKWEDAGKHLKKALEVKAMLTLQGDEQRLPLKVFDPRITRSLLKYHLAQASSYCADIEMSGYYCGQALEMGSKPQEAISAYQKALSQLNALGNQSAFQLEHLVLSTHLELSGFMIELQARIALLGGGVLESAPSQTHSTSDSLWHALAQPISAPQANPFPQLFPERRRALGILASTAMAHPSLARQTSSPSSETSTPKGESQSLDYIASLGLVERWLDSMNYRYAIRLVDLDQRVRASKVLNSTEEARAGKRLQGRNRLNRLLLNAFNFLKMEQLRVAVKYFQRLKSDLPPISFSLEMTSDLLSGKSFDQRDRQASQGQ